MFIVIAGSSNSGKSKKAEEIAVRLAGDDTKIYLATMITYDEEGKKRIEKHRRMRQGKGFITVEKPYDILEAFHKTDSHTSKTVLLECAANLTANEIFEKKSPMGSDTASKLLEDIISLSKIVKHLVVVTDIFEENDSYSDDTIGYIRTLNELNRRLFLAADEVITDDFV